MSDEMPNLKDLKICDNNHPNDGYVHTKSKDVMSLLYDACACHNENCDNTNCRLARGILKHVRNCTQQDDCRICSTLTDIHLRNDITDRNQFVKKPLLKRIKNNATLWRMRNVLNQARKDEGIPPCDKIQDSTITTTAETNEGQLKAAEPRLPDISNSAKVRKQVADNIVSYFHHAIICRERKCFRPMCIEVKIAFQQAYDYATEKTKEMKPVTIPCRIYNQSQLTQCVVELYPIINSIPDKEDLERGVIANDVTAKILIEIL